MIRTLLTLAAGIGVGVAVTFAADHDHHKAVKVTQLSKRDIIEKLDGKTASETVVEVTFEPGQKDSPHHHTGPVFGYVLEGGVVEESTAMLGRRHSVRVSLSNKESRWQPCRRTGWTGLQDEPRSE